MIRKFLTGVFLAASLAGSASAACIPETTGLKLATSRISDSGRVWFKCFNDNFLLINSSSPVGSEVAQDTTTLKTEIDTKAFLITSLDCSAETPIAEGALCYDQTLGSLFVATGISPGDFIPVGGGGSGGGGVPLGTLAQFGGGTIPAGYKSADGQALSTTTFSALFNVYGFTFGGSGGSFNLPDMRGRAAMGFDSSQAEFDTLGETGGSKTHAHSSPSHSHGLTLTFFDGPGSFGGAAQVPGTDGAAAIINASVGLPPYLTGNWIVRTGFEQDDQPELSIWQTTFDGTKTSTFIARVGISSDAASDVEFVVGEGTGKFVVKDDNRVTIGEDTIFPLEDFQLFVNGAIGSLNGGSRGVGLVLIDTATLADRWRITIDEPDGHFVIDGEHGTRYIQVSTPSLDVHLGVNPSTFMASGVITFPAQVNINHAPDLDPEASLLVVGGSINAGGDSVGGGEVRYSNDAALGAAFVLRKDGDGAFKLLNDEEDKEIIVIDTPTYKATFISSVAAPAMEASTFSASIRFNAAGTDGLSLACTPGESVDSVNFVGGIFTGGSCTTGPLMEASSPSWSGEHGFSNPVTFGASVTFKSSATASQFYAADGLLATPAYTFTSDDDTGMFLANPGRLVFSANGSEILRLSPAQGGIILGGALTDSSFSVVINAAGDHEIPNRGTHLNPSIESSVGTTDQGIFFPLDGEIAFTNGASTVAIFALPNSTFTSIVEAPEFKASTGTFSGDVFVGTVTVKANSARLDAVETELRRFVVKADSESVTASTVFQDDDDLFVNLPAGGTYWIDLSGIVLANSNNPEFKMRLTGPSQWDVRIPITIAEKGGTFAEGLFLSMEDVVIVDLNSGVPGFFIGSGSIVTHDTAGVLRLQWAQNSSNATPTTLFKGSAMKIEGLQ